MIHRALKKFGIATLFVSLLAGTAVADGGLAEKFDKALSTAKYVYIASTRKDGTLGKPAEIWFLYRNGAVYVGTPQTTWRVRRIKAGRPAAKIWVGSSEGPSFQATGSLVKDADVERAMLEAYAKKYPDGWSRYEKNFRDGFADGSRVIVKYTPAGS